MNIAHHTLILILFTAALNTQVNAQEIIKGQIKNELGVHLTQVSISNEKDSILAISTIKGNFEFKIKRFPTLLRFKKIGYETRSHEVSNTDFLNITLTKSTEQINEIYVLGHQQDHKVFEHTFIDGSLLSNHFESNPINSLRARVPGLQMSATAAGVTSGTNMNIRGMKSMVGGNQPLIVLDGIPIENETSGANQYGGQDWGNSLKDLNMFDVESVRVLKSATAAQHYGSRGMNGVIEITSKGKSLKPGLAIESNLGASIGHVYGMPSLLSEQEIQQINESRLAWLSTASHNYYQSFQQANAQVAHLALSHTADDHFIRLSYAADYNKGTYIGNTLDKNNVLLKSSKNWNKQWSTETSLLYNHSIARNAPSIGAQKFASLGHVFIDYPTDFATISNNDPLESETAWHLYGQQTNKTAQTIRAIVNNKWKINKHLVWDLAANLTSYQIDTKEKASGYFEPQLGSQILYHQQKSFRNLALEKQMDWMIKTGLQLEKSFHKHHLNSHVTYSYWQTNAGIEGSSLMPKDVNPFSLKDAAQKQTIERFQSLDNFQLASEFNIKNANYKSIQAADILLDYSFNNQLFVSSGIRFDQVKTQSNLEKLGKLNQFYPNIGIAYLYDSFLRNVFKLSKHHLNFAKVRANVGYTGNITGLFHYQSGVTDDLELPYPNLKTVYKPYYTNSGSWGNKDYQTGFSYEYAREFEIGTDISLWSNKINFQFTWYTREIDNYLYDIVSPLDKYNKPLRYVEAKVRNQGFEFQVLATPIHSKNLTWSSSLNFASNQNKFLALTGTNNSQNLLGAQHDVSLMASVNGNFGSIVSSYAQKKNSHGAPLLNAALEYVPSGSPIQIGNSMAKWIAGFENSITYKNVQLSALLDFKVGGDIYSGTHALLFQRAVLSSSKFGRSAEFGGVERKTAIKQMNPESNQPSTIYKTSFDGIIPNGVFDEQVQLFGKDIAGLTFLEAQEKIGKDAQGEYLLQPLAAPDYYAAHHDRAGIKDKSIFENSYIAFREIAIGYHFKQHSFKKNLPFEHAQIGLVGRNLGYLYKSLPYHLNPDGAYNNRNAGGFEYAALLPVRTFALFIKINF